VGSKPPARKFEPYVLPKDLPDRKTSKNQWINGTKTWSFQEGRLCVECGHVGQSKECKDNVLPAWEQSYLKSIVFGESPQTNFAMASYGAYDGNISAYGTDQSTNMSRASSQGPMTPSASTSSSIGFGFSGLKIGKGDPKNPAEVKAMETFYGEGSGPNKRPYLEPVIEQQPQQSQQPQQPFQFQAITDDRTKRKGQKRVGKKTEPQPLVGMFNDLAGKYDSPISIREVLQRNKVDISWMDLVAWSPAVCRELKRLCTHVAKKKGSKAKQPQQIQPGPLNIGPQFAPTFGGQMPQMPTTLPPIQTIPTAFQPMQNIQPMQPNMSVGPPVPPRAYPQSQPRDQSTQGTMQASSVEAERHTRFLSTMVGKDKAFRIPCFIQKPDGSTVHLDKSYVQADQGSDMNMISTGLVKYLGLQSHSLGEIGFAGLSMRTADHRETVLHDWTWLDISVEGVWRKIRCFVAPELTTGNEGKQEYLSLILGIPWLWTVNAIIAIQNSKIMIGDPSSNENIREVVGPELFFCEDHNLLMYPKSIMTAPHVTVEDADDSSSESDEDSDSGDDVSMVGDPKPPFI